MNAGARLEVRLRLPLDRFALELDFTTRAHVTGIFGPSGAGKSSLLQAIAGLERRARGRVLLGGELWLDSDAGVRKPPERRSVGYVPQDGLLFPHLDVRGNLLAGAARARRSGASVSTVLATVCRLLELEPLLDREPATLSGGERQRVALGRAICSGPDLLLLDEPLASLDLALRRRVLPLLRRIRAELSIPMLLVSHDPTEVQALCDDLIVLDRGRILTRGPVREVLTDPAVRTVAGAGGFENVLPATLVAHAGETSELGLGDQGEPRLTVPRVDADPGDSLLVGLPAREIIIATAEPHGLSARNLLPAVLRRIRPDGELRLLTAALGEGGPELTAIVTHASCRELGLTEGRQVHLIVKTVSCVVYGGR